MIFTKLQSNFFTCYLLSVVIPILLFSGIIYINQNNQHMNEYLNEKKNSLITEQNYLENQLNSAQNYSNQLKTNYALKNLLNSNYNSTREIVYAYNSQIYPQLSSIWNYDSMIDGLKIYTRNSNAAKILRYFEFMDALPLSEDQVPNLLYGFWSMDEDRQNTGISFYIGLSNSLINTFSGILKLNYNFNIFDSYVTDLPDTSIYVYLNEQRIYCINITEVSDHCLAWYNEQMTVTDTITSPQITVNSDYKCSIGSMTLQNGAFKIVKIMPMENVRFSYQQLFLYLLIPVVILFFASIIMFRLILQPFQNITRLSEHMNRQNTHILVPYTGTLTKDETSDLILSFNRMVKRINELSTNLLTQEMNLKNAQIEALQAQLNPHFFYGTLESIRMIAEANHQELISEITFSFGELMHYSLSREYLAAVKKEINMTRQYISIQEKRLGNRFDIRWELCELSDEWRCPKFVLFSMVENVFSHNVTKCRSFIHIVISVQTIADDLIFTVTNTGPGVSPDRLAQLQYLLAHPKEQHTIKSEHNGRSIFNINERLKLFYGEEYTFSIESQENIKTTCRVRIHKYFKGDDAERKNR